MKEYATVVYLFVLHKLARKCTWIYLCFGTFRCHFGLYKVRPRVFIWKSRGGLSTSTCILRFKVANYSFQEPNSPLLSN